MLSMTGRRTLQLLWLLIPSFGQETGEAKKKKTHRNRKMENHKLS